MYMIAYIVYDTYYSKCQASQIRIVLFTHKFPYVLHIFSKRAGVGPDVILEKHMQKYCVYSILCSWELGKNTMFF